ncbi:MAG: hypothetical protein M3126_05910 [Candidatus Eremiobacteraeota bacterium]|nr:hypothetical protein [Candidatus Eremiobacteraeota bacterium]
MSFVLFSLFFAIAILVINPSAGLAAENLAAQPVATATASGIPLTAAWKSVIYAFAKSNLRHAGWGLEHSERNYHVSMEIAKSEHMAVDEDVIFATAFLHDMDSIGKFNLNDVPHGVGSAKEAEPILREAGFPMAKFDAVRDAMATHMYYSQPSSRPESIVMHDADTLEFIGAIGIARTIGLIGDRTDLGGVTRSIEKNRAEIPSKLITRTARKIAAGRIQEMNVFLEALDRETFGKTAL